MSGVLNTQQTQTNSTTIDNRLLRVTFQVNDQLHSFDQRLYIRARGCKYANSLQNECTVDIANLNADTRNYILTETSPFNKNRTPKVLQLFAGRVSTGEFLVYQGEITTSQVRQPPEVMLNLKCGTAHSKKGKVGSRSGGKSQKLSIIASNIASNLNLTLNNQAQEKLIQNYSHSGDALSEVNNLNNVGGVNAFVDDNQLVLKTASLPLDGVVLDLSEQTGMVGIPVVTEQGLKVTFFYNNTVKLGGAIQITSKINPSANGLYVIYKLNFDLASWEKDFYYKAECLKAAG
jgi:baseplate hub protein gp41